jgi:serine/threonine-protein kinase
MVRRTAMSVTIGNVLGGKYRILRVIGDGGMGVVFEAKHERLGTRVAIKVIHPEVAQRPGIVDRFLQEARVSAQIRSPHVAQVIDVDQAPDGEAYMVMELLEGQTLLAVLDREKKLPLAIAAEYTRQILEGLEAAHALGVVHRDLKPENVFVTVAAGKPVLKLIDFGIAKVKKETASDTGQNLTMAGITMGTPEYMAPEQAFSADRADARADIYAVGVIFYEMLSGKRPVEGLDARLLAVKIEQGDVTPLIHAAPDVPPPIAGLVHQAMGPRPELRFQSAAEMRLALERTLAANAPETTRVHVDASGTGGALDRTANAAVKGGTAPLPVIERVPVAQPASAVSSVPLTTPQAAHAPPPEPSSPTGPKTQRGGPPAGYAEPVAPVIAQPPPPFVPASRAASTGRRGRSGSSVGIFVVLGLVVVGIIVAVVVALNDRGGGTTALPTATAPPSKSVAATGSTGPAPTDTVAPLATLGTGKVTPVNTGPTGPNPTGSVPPLPLDAGARPPDGGAPVVDAGTGIPHFPFPPPPDGGFVITIPSTIPIPTFTGFPPPPPQ